MGQSFVLVDDDQDILDILKFQMELDGHSVRAFSSSPQALAAIASNPPDCVVTDLMMPDIDGVELTRMLRANPKLQDLKIVVLSGKIYETDKNRALEAGADGFLIKSRQDPAEMLSYILDLLAEKLLLKFWGCRGTIPVPGPGTLKYGGNTSCVSLTFPNDHHYIFDAGTGIKQLSNQFVKSGRKKLTGTIFISHPHWDHINFLPFFQPLYAQGNQFTIAGPSSQKSGIEELVANQMEGLHFPITPREFGSQVLYKNLGEGQFQFGPATVETMLLCHPGNCLGYCVHFAGKKIAYVTDNELFPEESDMFSPAYLKRLTAFIGEADILITDSTYFDEEYPAKLGWGHSRLSAVCKLAASAKVRDFYLFHHDPDQDDAALERKLALAQEMCESLESDVRVKLAEAEEEVVITK